MPSKRTMILLSAIAIGAAAAGGVAIAGGSDDDEHETPITGPALERARSAALAHTGGGRVTATEAGDEEGAYEVEVTLPGGRQVDVHLDEGFHVLGAEGDGEEAGDAE